MKHCNFHKLCLKKNDLMPIMYKIRTVKLRYYLLYIQEQLPTKYCKMHLFYTAETLIKFKKTLQPEKAC